MAKKVNISLGNTNHRPYLYDMEVKTMSNEKQQTSVDQLFDQLSTENLLGLFTWDQMQRAMEILEQAKAIHKEEMIKNITDYNIQVSEFLLNPLFNLEHSKHGIACEKLSDIRNQFIYEQYFYETFGGNK